MITLLWTGLLRSGVLNDWPGWGRRSATSFLANQFAQHLGERGDMPARRVTLLKGETPRRRLGIPMFLGAVN